MPVADFYDDSRSLELDDRGSRLVVGRAPGDRLRVSLDRDQLVFAPGETLRFQVTPHVLSVDPDAKVHIETRLVEVRRSLPDGAELTEVYSRTDLVSKVLKTVRNNLLEGAAILTGGDMETGAVDIFFGARVLGVELDLTALDGEPGQYRATFVAGGD